MKHIYILSCETDGGIYHYLFDEGAISFVDKTPLDRPMYAVIKNNKFYVILREVDKVNCFGGILAFDISENGKLLNPTRIESTNGIVPCHLEVIDNDIFITNYLSGNLVKLGKRTVIHSGNSIHPTRQESPHTHFVCNTPDKDYVMCTDLGLDKVFVYTKELTKVSETSVKVGCGPRHIVFSEKGFYAFVACELSSTIEMFNYSNGKLRYLNSFSCLPEDFDGESTVAAIRRKGKNIYVSNRGHDSISVFDFKKGTLEFKEHVKCCGRSPRDINVIEDCIFSTNELSNNVTVFKIGDDGSLVKLDVEIEIPSPVCVLSN